MKKLLATLPFAGALIAGLTACAPVDTVVGIMGPRPNPEIMTLAKQAAADGLGDSEFSNLRRMHAEQLQSEAIRLCGTNPQGQAPPSCNVSVDEQTLPPAESVAELVAATAAVVPQLPAESVDLVIAQAVDAAALEPVRLGEADEPSAAPGSEVAADAEGAASILEQEYALRYAIGVARAYADAPLVARIDAVQASSDERVEAISRFIEAGTLVADPVPDANVSPVAAPSGGSDLEPGSEDAVRSLPAPAAGYEFLEGSGPVTAAEAAEVVERVQRDVVDQWRITAASANNEPWRRLAIRLAAHAQRT